MLKKIFNLFNSNIACSNNPQLALNILNSLSIGYSLNSQEQKLIKKCNSRQEILNEVINICGEPNSPMTRYIYAKAYAWSNIEYNEEAIKYLNLYLNNELYVDAYQHRYHDINNSLEVERKIHLYEMTRYLGQAYEKKYDFDKALECYKKCLEYQENFQVPYLDIANIYRKKNNLQESLKIMNKAKSSVYYKNDFKVVIDEKIKDYEEKIKKGYKYKPKNKN